MSAVDRAFLATGLLMVLFGSAGWVFGIIGLVLVALAPLDPHGWVLVVGGIAGTGEAFVLLDRLGRIDSRHEC